MKYKQLLLELGGEPNESDNSDPDDSDVVIPSEEPIDIKEDISSTEINENIEKVFGKRKLSRMTDMDFDTDVSEEIEELEDREEDESSSDDIGTLKSTRGKITNVDDFDDEDYITINKKHNVNKILKLKSNDDFDEFTEKYGFLDDNNELHINWNQLSADYKGILINQTATTEREEIVIYKGVSYKSWLQDDNYKIDNVIEFEKKSDIKEFKKISKPFDGKIVDPYLIDENQYVNIKTTVPSNKILLIDDLKTFDIFTNKYGILNEKNKLIMMNWDRIAKDYIGFYIDKENDFFNDRYTMAFLNGSQYKSWWNAGDIEAGVIYMFD